MDRRPVTTISAQIAGVCKRSRLILADSNRIPSQICSTKSPARPLFDAAAKCHDELPLGNHWVNGSGSIFAEMVLDGICGTSPGLFCRVTRRLGLWPWRKEFSVVNIAAHRRNYNLKAGKMTETSSVRRKSPVKPHRAPLN